MRPAGEVRLALIQAAADIARELGQPNRGATLAEMAARAQVGRECARNLVPKIKQSGQLQAVAERRVPGRNRPVLEYAPAEQGAVVHQGWADLGCALSAWAR